MKPNRNGGQSFSRSHDFPTILPLFDQAGQSKVANQEFLCEQTGFTQNPITKEQTRVRSVTSLLTQLRNFDANLHETRAIIGVLRWATASETSLQPNTIQPSTLDSARALVAQFDQTSAEELQGLRNPNDLR